MYSRCLDFCSVTVSGWGKCSRDKDWWSNTHQNHHHPPFPSDIPLEHLVRHIRLTQKTEVLKRHRQECVKEPAVDQIQWAMWHQGKTFWREQWPFAMWCQWRRQSVTYKVQCKEEAGWGKANRNFEWSESNIQYQIIPREARQEEVILSGQPLEAVLGKQGAPNPNTEWQLVLRLSPMASQLAQTILCSLGE